MQKNRKNVINRGVRCFPFSSGLFDNISSCSTRSIRFKKDSVAYQLAGALLQVDFGLLDAKVGESATAALDGCQSVHDLAITLDVGVHHTEDVLV